jgi:hypothetical protein
MVTHWEVMRLVVTEVMTETTAPAPTMGTMWICSARLPSMRKVIMVSTLVI